MPRGPKFKTLQDYERKATWIDECFVYPGACGNHISRCVYQLRHGPIGSSDIFVCHTCDNPQCIRDEHHFLGTRTDNMQDASRKGRLGISHRGRSLSESHRLAIANGLRGNKNFVGYARSLETRMKISASLKGRHLSDSHRMHLRDAIRRRKDES